MGKKSKRNRSTKPTAISTDDQPLPPSLRTPREDEEETPDNLKYEDPFEDVYEEEDIVDDEDNNNMDTDTAATQPTSEQQTPNIQSWTPLTHSFSGKPEELELDPTAYKMHHSLTPEWPCLSFDFLRDSNGNNRTRFPHSCLAVVGSQADKPNNNKVTVMKLDGLDRMQKGEIDEEDPDNEDSDDEDEVEGEPTLEYYSMKHYGGVNRIRTMPMAGESHIVACWGEMGTVNLYDIRSILDKLDNNKQVSSNTTNRGKNANEAFFTYKGHDGEGYAMDWHRTNTGSFATGDCRGNIHVWTPTEGFDQWDTASFAVGKCYESESTSVEDLQWSPSENTVLAAAECSGFIKIYDTRCKDKAMLACKAHANDSDVNVIGWNSNVTNLLASGSDDGVFSVWDLRNFTSTTNKPLARFNPHKKPITSLEWHPTDESMIVVSDEDATYIYDLSIEADENAGVEEEQIPPQMLFMHCGSTSTKEAHWHPQVTSMIMTTALSGFSAFIPSNL